jgi:hypothetical protein
MTADLPKFKVTTLAASAAVIAVPGTIRAVLVNAGADAAAVQFSDDADGSGAKLLEVHAPLTGCAFVNLDPLGGYPFPTKIYATITGTSPSVTIWYE